MKILDLDIETAPHRGLFFQTFKTTIPIDNIEEPGYILCFAARWEGESHMEFASCNDRGGTKAMLKQIWKLLDAADVVVHYYGKSFDVPWLNGQFFKAGMVPPSNYKQVDLCQVVRANFKLASYKLAYVVEYFGIGRKIKTAGISLWRDCMAGDAKAWKAMERYNKRDVTVLRPLRKRLLPWIKWPAPLPLYAGDDHERACPNCGKHRLVKKGVEYPAKVNAYQRWKCSNCGTNARGRLPLKAQVKPGAV